jgi:predicted enzyme related to lactoylglutathione lyase
MKKILIVFSIALMAYSCSTADKTESKSEKKVDAPANTELAEGSSEIIEAEAMELDTTPRVVGIGGIFFKSAKGDSINTWYSDNLGMSMTPYGSIFESRNANRPEEVNYLSWGTFPESTTYFAPSESDFMINYRVQNMDGLVRNLRANGVIIVDSIVTYDYGKFVHIMDLDGNKIELWEPIDHVLSEMGGPTNK